MSILTLEILGRPVACIYSQDRAVAERMIRESWFHRDLLSHHSGGTRLWDGSAELSLRPSTQDESDIVAERFKAHHLANPHSADRGAVIFLVPLDRDGNDFRGAVDEGDVDFPV